VSSRCNYIVTRMVGWLALAKTDCTLYIQCETTFENDNNANTSNYDLFVFGILILLGISLCDNKNCHRLIPSSPSSSLATRQLRQHAT
jgi:hypothetical protein